MTDGLIVVDKPAGWTSHQVVGRLRRILGTRKVGHAGTLDPMATGLLLVGAGRATRLLGHLALTDKTYSATIRLGQATVTDDAEGDLIESSGAAGVGAEQVSAAMAAYRGRITQVPSAVSAIKVGGVRSYARVRAGEEVQLAGREVTVSRFELVGTRRPGVFGWREGEGYAVDVLDVDVEVDCSSGTYIRALARDLGRDLGTGGHLVRLRRTRVGPFTFAEPHLSPNGLEAGPGVEIPLLGLGEVARRCFPVIELDEAEAAGVRHGQALGRAVPADPTALLAGGELLALYRPKDAGAVPVAVFVGG
ncbi:MAG: tRNA pseudouridine(55) synthase TruB [Propionibacteriaceae bacterium]|nr:tRNA pseudouridine(55) synthase TruB [Propionibacteriaceae bacterium]